LGFYLLVLFGPQGWVGMFTQWLGVGLLSFSFTGLLLGSIVCSLPFAVQPIQYAFEAMGRRPMEVAATLRARPWDAFFTVALPLAKPGLLTATVLSFAHTVGEFGVVLMIGGNIPGQTRVVSTQIFGHVEAMEYGQAHALAAGMVVFSFVVLVALSRLKQRSDRVLT
jgi:molybdate transport system permease protein